VRLSEHAVGDSPHIFHRTISIVHDICEALVECEAANVNTAEVRAVLEPARQIHGRSPFVRRLQDWPRGYAGDFETIEWLWRGENHAVGPVARAIERYALTSSIAQQHRNKVVFQAACILEAAARQVPCRILSLACGSSPDIRTLLPHVKPQAEFVLCDSDRDALTFSADRLADLRDRCRFVRGTIPRVLRQVRALGPYQLILAGGLFDYLPDRLLQRTLEIAWTSLLAPGGRLIFTNIASGNPFRVWIEHLAEWRLIERSEEDIQRISQEAGIETPIELRRDTTGLAILASAYREGS
jgi:hypothetical protein